MFVDNNSIHGWMLGEKLSKKMEGSTSMDCFKY